MDYQRIYNQLVLKRQEQILSEGYTEKHHIVPRCMSGSDDPSNLVSLTAREHFIAHQLLAKIYKTKDLIYSAFRMSNYKTHSSKQYSWLKEAFIQTLKCVPKSKDHRAKLSKSKQRYYEDHPEAKLRISVMRKELCKNPEHILKMSAFRKGVSRAEEFGIERAEEITKKHKESMTNRSKEDKEKTANLKSIAMKKLGSYEERYGIEEANKKKEQLAEQGRNRKLSDESKQKIKDKRKEQIFSVETKLKMSESQKKRWAKTREE